MSYISHLICILSIFVVCLQVLEFFVSYSKVFYGNEQVRNSMLNWMISQFGFFTTWILTRGLMIFMFVFLISFVESSIFSIIVCIILFGLYSHLLVE